MAGRPRPAARRRAPAGIRRDDAHAHPALPRWHARAVHAERAAPLGVSHGSVPHALVLCHRAGSTEIEGSPGHPIPPLRELVELHERMALPRRPARVAALALNTAGLGEREAREVVAAASDETGLPAADPVREGADALLDAVLAGLP